MSLNLHTGWSVCKCVFDGSRLDRRPHAQEQNAEEAPCPTPIQNLNSPLPSFSSQPKNPAHCSCQNQCWASGVRSLWQNCFWLRKEHRSKESKGRMKGGKRKKQNHRKPTCHTIFLPLSLFITDKVVSFS